MNGLAKCEEISQLAEYAFGTTYDAATDYTTTYYVTGTTPPQFPAGSIAGTEDSGLVAAGGVGGQAYKGLGQ